MAEHVERPLIFPLSNPTERIEAIPADLIEWTQGRALIGTGTPWDPVPYDGVDYEIGQANNALHLPRNRARHDRLAGRACDRRDAARRRGGDRRPGRWQPTGRGAPPAMSRTCAPRRRRSPSRSPPKRRVTGMAAAARRSGPGRTGGDVAGRLPAAGGGVMSAAAEPELRSLPIGTGATGTRIESDSMGEIEVPAERYWGAQTQRSLIHFSIGDDRMPKARVPRLRLCQEGRGARERRRWAARPDAGGRDRRRGRRGDRGQARRGVPALRLADGLGHAVEHERQRGDRQPRESAARRRTRHQDAGPPERPRQHGAVLQRHLPHGDAHRDAARDPRRDAAAAGRARATRSEAKAVQWVDVVKIGRTHLQDATPLTVGQEWSGWAAQLRDARDRLESRTRRRSHELAAGGTAVGTGLNAPDGFGERDRRQDRRADRAAAPDRAEQVRRAGLARRDGRGQRRSARGRRWRS